MRKFQHNRVSNVGSFLETVSSIVRILAGSYVSMVSYFVVSVISPFSHDSLESDRWRPGFEASYTFDRFSGLWNLPSVGHEILSRLVALICNRHFAFRILNLSCCSSEFFEPN